ncbi:hypothetical protein KIPB_005386 [Kipferlia bialata]|uniref:Uncharacterized protein n=1 Tax=Kipferlia bialata TaxID=797122 RepID=A0A9K3CWY0_9EUKA|nr:hypothetical protein KIPB_005386 [Kipferlia bialata]|eukprot:g5386.t1
MGCSWVSANGLTLGFCVDLKAAAKAVPALREVLVAAYKANYKTTTDYYRMRDGYSDSDSDSDDGYLKVTQAFDADGGVFTMTTEQLEEKAIKSVAGGGVLPKHHQVRFQLDPTDPHSVVTAILPTNTRDFGDENAGDSMCLKNKVFIRTSYVCPPDVSAPGGYSHTYGAGYTTERAFNLEGAMAARDKVKALLEKVGITPHFATFAEV